MFFLPLYRFDCCRRGFSRELVIFPSDEKPAAEAAPAGSCGAGDPRRHVAHVAALRAVAQRLVHQ
ncbi:MAG TPA: hypothetical protein VFF71_11420, partial [Luteimonas sp.]|nr:hypothetical protein [Luteimonas sp.]